MEEEGDVEGDQGEGGDLDAVRGEMFGYIDENGTVIRMALFFVNIVRL